jgi:hypothetical protein
MKSVASATVHSWRVQHYVFVMDNARRMKLEVNVMQIFYKNKILVKMKYCYLFVSLV